MTSILSSKHRVPLTVIGGLVGIMLATSIAAESRKLFRWVDEEGNVHYSDVVPPARQTGAQRTQRSRPDGAQYRSCQNR
ncbi:MAG: DUF4124 domain-containing protein [Pseudomonadota bacterium]|nr:MAG: DUF4124 domain-containing protein [Pseudomonadota bacterium]